MTNVQLSPRVKKLAKDFHEHEGQFGLSDEQFRSWLQVFDVVREPQRSRCLSELIALALRIEREGGEPASKAVAQLYFFAAGLTSDPPVKEKKAGW
jgi:hypothetical protein